MIIVLWWYAIVTTIFEAMRSKTFMSYFSAFVDTVWNGICQSGKWIVDVENTLAQVGDRIPNGTMTIVAHWLLFIIVIVGVAVTSVALVVYFGDLIKGFVKLNLVVILQLVQSVYVGIRVYVNGCKRARVYY